MERESHFHGTTNEPKRYVQPPISDLREMKFSASTGGGEGSHSSWQTSSDHPAVAGASKIAGGTIIMLPNAAPFASCLAQQNVADENRATVRELERISSSLSERSQDDGKGTEKLAVQSKRCEELLRSRKESVPTWHHDDLHRSQTLGNSDDTTQLGMRKRRKDEFNPDSDDEIVLGPAHHSHVGLQEHQDGEAVTNVLAVGEIVQDAINQPIASVSLSKSTGAEGQQMVQVLKKRGRPVKKYRGRMAREKQAIRDAERAEKVAVKEKKLPVLDLLLKVIEDPTVESPVEAAVLTGSSVISDTAVLHEVGDVLKELVAQIAVKELQPKSSRSRRCWEHLPVRIPSKRQEYRKLNVPVEQRKYRRDILERDKKQCEERVAYNVRSGEGPLSI
ncbi:hypothetical protein KIN20_027141 [Parelaphostrongylus tenuis]|uniref:Uncharacterized protein n=1 Tax=Parelaphostrongylus tenuis TaxID=148309 RepID=A0AAD5QZ12_PARTN|nr:hypothetical protein KIN20_027141 [Parelaphostrongylus tenuis]